MSGGEGSPLRAALTRPDLPSGFERWRTTIEPGTSRPTSAAEWAGALVLVETGSLEVACRAGGHERFASGNVLALGWLPIVELRNPGVVAVRLLAVRRIGERPRHGYLRVTRTDEARGQR